MPGFAWEPAPDAEDKDITPLAVLVPVDSGKAKKGQGGGAARTGGDAAASRSATQRLGAESRVLYLRSDKAEGLLESVRAPEGFRFAPVPFPVSEEAKNRDVVYLYGCSGAGKSHWLREYMTTYHQLWPRRKIYLISALDKDETLDEQARLFTRLTPKSLQCGDTYKKVPSRFEQALVIADDIEGLNPRPPRRKRLAGGAAAVPTPTVPDTPSEREAVLRLLDAIATKGRHTETTLLWAAHLPSDFSRSRIILSEASRYVIYPHGSSLAHVARLVGDYGGVDKKEVERLRLMDDRSIVIGVRYPRYLLSDSAVELLAMKGSTEEETLPAAKRLKGAPPPPGPTPPSGSRPPPTDASAAAAARSKS